jgi:glycosyltransferase involved in cell wall biosynthesis
MNPLSIIIPTLNESENIEEFLRYLRTFSPYAELIVSDGGSTDHTVQLAQPFARIIRSHQGRGRQMNAGSRAASGDIFWFLHADCRPHPESLKAISRALLPACLPATDRCPILHSYTLFLSQMNFSETSY